MCAFVCRYSSKGGGYYSLGLMGGGGVKVRLQEGAVVVLQSASGTSASLRWLQQFVCGCGWVVGCVCVWGVGWGGVGGIV